MEIMGLAIVIVLITLGVLFVVRFGVLRQTGGGIKESYTETQLAANMVNSLLKSSAENCFGHSIAALLQDCASTPPGTTPAIICPTGQNSCEYAQLVATYVLENTLDIWNREYEFKACLWNYDAQECTSDTFIDPIGTVCRGSRERKSIQLHTRRGELVVRLDICS